MFGPVFNGLIIERKPPLTRVDLLPKSVLT
jgi:hypothetical protein